jgi:intracellular sulfur oxidation DsrE/DsrF family protein
MIIKATALVLAPLIFGAPAMARDAANPQIAGFGKIVRLPHAAMQPDRELDYRVAFNISKAAAQPDQVNPGLEKVARYINLLAASGVHPKKGSILAVVHGPATELVLNQGAFRRKHGTGNPNIPLIEALAEAGVEVHVCGQALAGQKIAHSEVFSGVTIDLSALVTLTTLQLKGWSVVSD